MNKDKFEIEKEILFTIYSREIVENYTVKGETPDFIITDSKNKKKIGVEITRLFNSQSSAALKDEKFSNKFINEHKPEIKKKKKKKPFLRKAHVAKLVSDIAEGTIQKDYVIVQQISLVDYLDFLENLISKKSNSYIHQKDGIEFTNLFIFDEDNFFKTSTLKITNFYEIIRKHSVFDTILKSNFQEILLYTEFKSGFYTINLKRLIFLYEYFLYRDFWKNKLALSKENKDNFFLMIKHFCATMHLLFNFSKVYLVFDENNNRSIVFGDTYWVFDENKIIKEGSFLALELNENRLIKNVLPKHISNSTTHKEYSKFRLTLVPQIEEGMFYKKNRK